MEVASMEIKSQHGLVVVIAKGRTGTGQGYIKDSKVLDVKSVRDPNFKAQLATAIKELLERTE